VSDNRIHHNFYEISLENYWNSPLKKIINRFELFLHSYMRELVTLSIEDWVNFIQSFTQPNIAKGERWNVNKEPLINIHIITSDSKVKEKKGKKDKKKEEEKAAEGDKIRIVFSPSLEEVHTFLMSAFDKVIESTNSISYLESELMPFLKDGGEPKEGDQPEDHMPAPAPVLNDEKEIFIKRGANFRLTDQFPLIANNIKRIQ
jgi:hypothetical protein